MYGSLGTRVTLASLSCVYRGRVTFKINGYFVLVARRYCLLKQVTSKFKWSEVFLGILFPSPPFPGKAVP